MYLDFFHLRKRPFTAAPDPAFFYPSEKHKEALACVLYTVEQRKGFALITGEVGTGKTIMCRAALARLEGQVESAVITNTALTAKQLIEAVCEEFELDTRRASKYRLIQRLNEFLIQRYRQNVHVVLVIDEAQNLDKRTLEEVRLLGNLESDEDKLLQIILVGQPELRRKIGSPELRQLHQRIAVKFHLYPLTAAEVSDYIDHRLRVAGADGADLFAPKAKHEAYAYSGGIPRLINLVCDHALLEAYVSDQHQVTAEVIRKVVRDMEGYYMDPQREAQQPLLDPIR